MEIEVQKQKFHKAINDVRRKILTSLDWACNLSCCGASNEDVLKALNVHYIYVKKFIKLKHQYKRFLLENNIYE